MFNIIVLQENANQTHDEISLHIHFVVVEMLLCNHFVVVV